MRSALYPVKASWPILRFACSGALLLAFLLPASLEADCRCEIQSSSSSLSFEGRALPASLPCGARIFAADKGALELASGMRLSLAAGASFALPAAICGQAGGETLSSAVSGVVRLLSSTAQPVNLSDSVPTGLREGKEESTLALVLRVEGPVELRGRGEPPLPARSDLILVDGETLRTGADGFAELLLGDGSHVLVGANQNFDPRALQQ